MGFPSSDRHGSRARPHRVQADGEAAPRRTANVRRLESRENASPVRRQSRANRCNSHAGFAGPGARPRWGQPCGNPVDGRHVTAGLPWFCHIRCPRRIYIYLRLPNFICAFFWGTKWVLVYCGAPLPGEIPPNARRVRLAGAGAEPDTQCGHIAPAQIPERKRVQNRRRARQLTQ
jgi:hypothetical protein